MNHTKCLASIILLTCTIINGSTSSSKNKRHPYKTISLTKFQQHLTRYYQQPDDNIQATSSSIVQPTYKSTLHPIEENALYSYQLVSSCNSDSDTTSTESALSPSISTTTKTSKLHHNEQKQAQQQKTIDCYRDCCDCCVPCDCCFDVESSPNPQRECCLRLGCCICVTSTVIALGVILP